MFARRDPPQDEMDLGRVRSGHRELPNAGSPPAKIPLAVHLLESLTSVTEVQDTIVKKLGPTGRVFV